MTDDQARTGSAGNPRELLLIVNREQAPQLSERIKKTYPVRQIGSPRILVVESSADIEGQLRSTPGLTVVTPGQELEAMQGLDETERLFIDAWLMRMRDLQSKVRAGEGLDWDAPGFVPPDPDRKRSR